MKKYECMICGYIYDNKEHKTAFTDLGNDYTCPVCSAPKSEFEEIE